MLHAEVMLFTRKDGKLKALPQVGVYEAHRVMDRLVAQGQPTMLQWKGRSIRTYHWSH